MKKRTGFENVGKILSLIGKPIYYGLVFFVYGLIFFLALFKKLFSLRPALKKPERKPKVKRTKSIIVYKCRRSLISFKLISFLLGGILSFFVCTSLFRVVFDDLPSPEKLTYRNQNLTTKIFDRNGTLLYKIYRQENRTQISLSELPDYVWQATIAIEDKDFFRHQGLSLKGIFRALYQNIFLGEKTGGSTITQQLVKNVLLNSEKTWKRKIKEAVLAILVEKKYSKNQILEMYLNEIGYGGAAYGIEEASQKYFGKPAIKLDRAEAALLAGLTVSPTRYSPFGNNASLAKERQKLVLERMVEDGYITEQESTRAREQELKYVPQIIDIKAPHFVMYIKDLLVQKYGEKAVEQGGLEVTTSLDLKVQETVQIIVKDEIIKLSNLHITNGSALVTNPKTGEILAMVGSKDYNAKDIDGNFNVTTSQRQPGSSIKPINYSIALENGFTAATLIDDSPITYKVPGQEPYSPKNYDSRFHGNVPLRTALASSYNVPAVKILAAFGVQRMINRGTEMGITSWNDPSRYGLSLTLGGGEVKMVDMAVAYGVFANNGIRIDLNPLLEVKDHNGKILEKKSGGKETPILNPGVAFLLNSILSDNKARAPAFGYNSVLNTERQIAVKTGTTQNLRDNWTIGYTPSLLATVWVGNNDNSPMSYVASGVTGASPIWRKIMDELLKNKPLETFTKPENIREVTICQTTVTLPCEGCPNIRTEYFIEGTEPKSTCRPEVIQEILQRQATPTP